MTEAERREHLRLQTCPEDCVLCENSQSLKLPDSREGSARREQALGAGGRVGHKLEKVPLSETTCRHFCLLPLSLSVQGLVNGLTHSLARMSPWLLGYWSVVMMTPHTGPTASAGTRQESLCMSLQTLQEWKMNAPGC